MNRRAMLLGLACSGMTSGCMTAKLHPFNNLGYRFGPAEVAFDLEEIFYRAFSHAQEIIQASGLPIKLEGHARTRTVSYDDKAQSSARVNAGLSIEPYRGAVLYPSGKYAAVEAMGIRELMGAVVTFLARAGQYQGVRVSGTFEGGADGRPVKSVVYDGRFGNIVRADAVSTAAGTYPMLVARGQRLDNFDLAFLRAYGVYWQISEISQLMEREVAPIRNKTFKLNYSENSGMQYRFVKVDLVVEIDAIDKSAAYQRI